MKRIIVNSTDYTPALDFNPTELSMLFKGVSRPENVGMFYQQALDWIKDLNDESDSFTNSTISVIFKLDYCNSASQKYILVLLEKLHKLEEKNISIAAEWHYDKEDDKMREDGEDIADAIGLEFVFHTF